MAKATIGSANSNIAARMSPRDVLRHGCGNAWASTIDLNVKTNHITGQTSPRIKDFVSKESSPWNPPFAKSAMMLETNRMKKKTRSQNTAFLARRHVCIPAIRDVAKSTAPLSMSTLPRRGCVRRRFISTSLKESTKLTIPPPKTAKSINPAQPVSFVVETSRLRSAASCSSSVVSE